MSEGVKNGLAGARSAYLRTAMYQPVDWNEWGSEAFAKAQAEDKPILLDIGAVWCHWCHVMDRESYENAETAEVINKFFIAVKVDRDERPDVDSRYQAAAAAVSGQGGWPLTAFLTSEGKPYFAGTYFPPEDAHGRPSSGTHGRNSSAAPSCHTTSSRSEEPPTVHLQSIDESRRPDGRTLHPSPSFPA